MQRRLREILEELEDINAHIQQGCVDPSNLNCFKDSLSREYVMAEADYKTGDAFSAIDNLLTLMKEEEQ